MFNSLRESLKKSELEEAENMLLLENSEPDLIDDDVPLSSEEESECEKILENIPDEIQEHEEIEKKDIEESKDVAEPTIDELSEMYFNI